MRALRRCAAIAVGVVVAVATPVAAASDRQPSDAASMIASHTGQHAREFTAQRIGSGSHVARAAVSRRSWIQDDGSGTYAILAELRPGQTTARFPDVVPETFSIVLQADGSADVVDNETGKRAGTIARPWALDAEGRSLATYYVVTGRDVIQVVDTREATFPVVADPRVSAGWWYYTPVYYVELGWSETNSLKVAVYNDWSNAPALLCGYLPSTTAKITCGAIWIGIRANVKETVTDAIAAKKCFKARLPASGGAAAAFAYDAYYLTCKS